MNFRVRLWLAMWKKSKRDKTDSKDLNRNLYTNIHSRIIHNSQKAEATQMSINRWINKVCHMHSIEYYLALKKNILKHASIWMKLEDIVLGE
jgi:hypothetical protein